MKKTIFTALVAIVAIGGAFAGSVNKILLPNPVFNKATCSEITGCTSIPGTPACGVDAEFVESDCNTPVLAFERL